MNTDLITMIGNVARSFFEVQLLVSGLAYILGLLLIFSSLMKFKAIAGSRYYSQDQLFVPTAYFLGGAVLLFLPSAITMFSNTFFGADSVLQYSDFNPYNIVNSMTFIVRTAGLIWFVRGCVLMIHASEPGVQKGFKGLIFLVAGIFAMNFEATIRFINWSLEQIMQYTVTLPASG